MTGMRMPGLKHLSRRSVLPVWSCSLTPMVIAGTITCGNYFTLDGSGFYRFPALDPLSHDAGHLWPALFGWTMDPHWSPVHLVSFVQIGGGFILIAAAWRVLHAAQRDGRLAVTGPYAHLRHPQYAGFALIMIGFFLQWPTLVTGLMLPVLLVMYWRLAKREEREVASLFGDAWRHYAARVPAFLPQLFRLARRDT